MQPRRAGRRPGAGCLAASVRCRWALNSRSCRAARAVSMAWTRSGCVGLAADLMEAADLGDGLAQLGQRPAERIGRPRHQGDLAMGQGIRRAGMLLRRPAVDGGFMRERGEDARYDAGLVLDVLADAGQRVSGLRGWQVVGGLVDALGQRVQVRRLLQTGERARRLLRCHRMRPGVGSAAVGSPMLEPATVALVVWRAGERGPGRACGRRRRAGLHRAHARWTRRPPGRSGGRTRRRGRPPWPSRPPLRRTRQAAPAGRRSVPGPGRPGQPRARRTSCR